ncbi:MAG: phosphoglycerate dehydrogenase [Planctomycetes bacterium]|nr:phosphoglycerate dehydrogenase [Planctomycetota bacterium]
MSSSAKVLVADAIATDELSPLVSAGVQVDHRAGISKAELLEVIGAYDGLLVRSRTQVDAAVFAAGTSLRVVGRAGTGVDNVDLAAATRAGVVVMNVPSGNTNAAAELTIALIAALCRNIVPAAAALRAGRFEQKPFVGVELTGRTLGVIGLGRIGRAVARKAQGLGLKVVGYDPLLAPAAVEELGIVSASLEALAAQSDIISVHVPLAEKTKHMIDAALIRCMKPGVRLLNVARGGIVDESALLAALESGAVAGAALDVFETEPPTSNPLVQHPRVLATPHLGASTEEAQSAVARLIAQQVARFLTQGVVENAVNLWGMEAEERAVMEPWLLLARRLGAVAAALLQGRPDRMEVVRFGDGTRWRGEPLAAEALVGALTPWLGGRLNAVNARLLAGERGFAVEERMQPEHRSFPALLRVALHSAEDSVVLDGTLFGRSLLRVVRAYGMNIDAIPEGAMLFVRHADKPGMIGRIGTLLAEHGVNIANMSVGRHETRDGALSVLNLDQEAPQAVLDALRVMDAVQSCRAVPASVSA